MLKFQKSKMAAAAVLKKSRSQYDRFDEIWRADAARPSSLKIRNFKIQDGDGRHFEKSKNRHISAAFRAILTKFGMLKFQKSKMAEAPS